MLEESKKDNRRMPKRSRDDFKAEGVIYPYWGLVISHGARWHYCKILVSCCFF